MDTKYVVFMGKVAEVTVGNLEYQPPTLMNKYHVTYVKPRPAYWPDVFMENCLFEDKESAEKEAEKERRETEKTKKNRKKKFAFMYKNYPSFRAEFDKFYAELYEEARSGKS